MVPQNITVYGGVKVAGTEFLDHDIIQLVYMPIVGVLTQWTFAGDQGPEESNIVVDVGPTCNTHDDLAGALVNIVKALPREASLVPARDVQPGQWVMMAGQWRKLSVREPGHDRAQGTVIHMEFHNNGGGVLGSGDTLGVNQHVIALPLGWQEY